MKKKLSLDKELLTNDSRQANVEGGAPPLIELGSMVIRLLAYDTQIECTFYGCQTLFSNCGNSCRCGDPQD